MKLWPLDLEGLVERMLLIAVLLRRPIVVLIRVRRDRRRGRLITRRRFLVLLARRLSVLLLVKPVGSSVGLVEFVGLAHRGEVKEHNDAMLRATMVDERMTYAIQGRGEIQEGLKPATMEFRGGMMMQRGAGVTEVVFWEAGMRVGGKEH